MSAAPPAKAAVSNRPVYKGACELTGIKGIYSYFITTIKNKEYCLKGNNNPQLVRRVKNAGCHIYCSTSVPEGYMGVPIIGMQMKGSSDGGKTIEVGPVYYVNGKLAVWKVIGYSERNNYMHCIRFRQLTGRGTIRVLDFNDGGALDNNCVTFKQV